MGLKLHHVKALPKVDEAVISEKLCHYFATNKKIAITHLWHAIEPQTICIYPAVTISK